jgi:hypothetical protein
MSTQIQRRRGTTAEHSTFTGVEGELTVDTTKDTAVVHDGTTVGGHPLQKQYPPLGSAAAPTYTFTGDTNTGIYSPGADQVAVATNGTGRLFVDDQGRVGVGAAAVAGVNFNVQGSTPILRVTGASATNPTFQLSAAGVASWSQVVDASNSAFYISNGTERLRITSSGNVGIGVSSPSYNIHGANYAGLGTQASSGAGAGIHMIPSSSVTNWFVGANYVTTGTFQIIPSTAGGGSTFTTPALTVDSSSRVGIGTTSPANPLHIRNDAGTAQIKLDYLGNSSNIFGSSDLFLQPNGATAMTLKSGGNVGIGTTSPDDTLHLVGSTGYGLKNTDGTHTVVLRTVSGGGILKTASNHALVFGTNDTERARIDSSGNVGIGTSSPGSNLEIVGGTTTAGPGAELRLSSRDQTIAAADEIIGSVTFKNSDASGGMAGYMAKIDAASNRLFDGDPASGMNLRFFAGTAADGVNTPPERMRLTSAGRLGIGTTNPSSALHVIGNEIRFSNSANTSYYGTISHDASTTGNNIYNVQDTGGHVFQLNGTEKTRIDSSGRLLVGTSTARAITYVTPGVQVESTNYNNASQSLINNSSTDSNPEFLFGKTGSSTLGSTALVTNGHTLGIIGFAGADGSAMVRAAQIAALVDGTPGANDMPGRLVFSTTADGASSPTERMRIVSEGHILFNTTDDDANIAGTPTSSPVASFKVGSGEGFRVSTTGSHYWNKANDGAVHVYRRNGADVGSITVSAGATAYNTSSDYRLKENVVAVTDGITRLQQLKPSRFNFIVDPDKTVDGFP